LLRVNIKPNIKIYNESDKVVNVEEIGTETPLISILEIQGIKFTSRNFQIEVELKQSLVVSPDPFLDSCFIKKPSRPQMVQENQDSNKESNNKESNNKESNNKETDNKESNNKESNNKESNNKESNNKESNNKEVIKKEINKEESSLFDVVDLDFFEENENNEDSEDNLEDLTNLVEPDFDSTTVSNTLANSTTTNAITNSVTKINIENPVLQEVNISLDIEDLNEPDNTTTLTEVDISAGLENGLESITLKKPNQVYYEIYKKAREKAKAAKKEALLAYLEVKNIKKTYMLDNIDESDESDDEIVSNSESESDSD
jgi:hypothetical protein